MASPALTNLPIENSPKLPEVPTLESTSGNVSTTDLTTPGLLSPVQPAVVDTNADATLSGLRTMAHDRLEVTQQSLQEAQAQQQSQESELLRFENLALDEAGRQQQLEEQAKLAESRRFLMEQTSGIKSDLASLDAFDAETENFLESFRGKGRGVSSNIIDRQNSERRRLRNLDKLTMGANLARRVAATEILQGNITLAQQEVDRAVELEFKPIKDQIANIKERLKRSDEGVKTLTTAEQNQLNAYVSSAEAFIADKKSTEKSKVQIAQDALAGGADQATVQAIMGAETESEALQAGSQFVGRLDRLAKEASINASNASALNSQIGAELKQHELRQIQSAGNNPEDIASSLDNFSFLRNAVNKVIELSDGASPNPTAEFVRRNVGSSSTENTQLLGYVDTLKANMLTLATDPSIKQFFGPQMSDADVRLMTAAGSNLRPDEQTPDQLKEEALRIDDWINRAETAVREGAKGTTVPPNTITAPDGTLIEIID